MMWYIAAAIMVILLVIVRVTTGRRPVIADDEQKILPPGNVSVFMDDKGRMDIIPFSMDRLKRGRACEYPITINAAGSPQEVGSAIRRGLSLCISGKSLTSEELMKSLGFYDWKDYSRGKKSVSVTCRDGEVVFNSTLWRPDGSFAFRVRGYERVLPEKLSDMELGDTVLALMKLSR